MYNSNFHIQGPQIHQFNNIAPQPIPRSTFKRDFTRRSTFDADLLIPVFCDEILPGDDVHLKMTAFARLATPIKPIMDNLYMDTFWFFVPNRLVWENWEKFQGQQNNPGDSTEFTIPVLDHTQAPLSTTGFLNGSLHDYWALPTLVNDLQNISALYDRAYKLIFGEWFRDENLQSVVPAYNFGDGPDSPTQVIYRRNKRKDYFTSALPWPQKGDPVTIPLEGTAPIVYSGTPAEGLFRAASSGGLFGPGANQTLGSLTPDGRLNASPTNTVLFYEPNGTLSADFDNSNAEIAINTIRQAALYQQILELDARGGTRYVESIYSRFGVISPDFRLQRPELIGQGTSRVNIYAVPQTSPTVTGQTPQGNLAAFGTNVIQGHGCRYSATEHGMIIGLVSVRADLTYQQGIPKKFSRRTRLDFYEPLLNGLGEQAILNKELFAQGTSADDEVFGYQERFAEYRFMNSEITGKFRSNDPQTLDVWHLSQEFASLPTLGSAFITNDTPMSRVLAVTNEPQFLFDASFDYTHVRPMPIRSNPGINRL